MVSIYLTSSFSRIMIQSTHARRLGFRASATITKAKKKFPIKGGRRTVKRIREKKQKEYSHNNSTIAEQKEK